MFETLDTYSIKRLPLDTDADHLKTHDTPSNSLDRDMLISVTNSYLMAYASDQYLFKVDHELGVHFINALKRVLPKKQQYIYVAYTDSFKASQLCRMVQDIWAFPNKRKEKQYNWEMLKAINDLNNTYLVKLPIRIKQTNANWIQSFADPYYATEKLDWYQAQITNEIDKQDIALKNYRIKPISSTKVKSLSSKKETAGETVKAIEFNQRLMKFYKKLKHTGDSIQMREEAQRLKHERGMIDHHMDVPGALTDLLIKE